MTLEELTAKYIRNTKFVFETMKVVKNEVFINEEKVRNVVKYAENYWKDANYYKDRNKFETSLASVAYCEGLLDALRLLGLVDFQWPKT
jgi:FAD synthetase